MTNKMRQDFEAWAVSDGYEIEKSDDKRFTYSYHETECAWNGWKASRAALCVELPDLDAEMDFCIDQFDDDGWCAYGQAIGSVKIILDKSGVRYK